MTVEANLWNRNNSSWREVKDSATISIDVSVNYDASFNLVAGGVGTTQLANDSVTYAKMQNVSAQFRVLGRKSSGAGDVEECTLSEVLDFVGSAAQGDILYRGASAWARLGAGSNRQFLQTQGAAANPQWASVGEVLLTSGTVSNATTLDLVLTTYTAFRAIKVVADFLPVTDTAALHARFSTDGGSTYDATGYSYASHWAADTNVTGIDFSGSANQIFCSGNVGNVSTEGVYGEFLLINQASTARNSRILWHTAYRSGAATSETVTASGAGAREAAQDTDALRFLFSTGNISAGNYAVYGLL